MASEAPRSFELPGSVWLGDRLSNGAPPPGFSDKADITRNVLLADIAGGEHDLEIGSRTLCYFGQFDSAHAGHADISKQDLDFGMSLEQLQGLVTVVGVEHRTAEGFHDAHRRRTGLGMSSTTRTATLLNGMVQNS